MAINQHLRLSPTFFRELSAYMTFKADFHKVYIQAWKDLEQNWHDLPYLVTETDVQEDVLKWLAEWHTPSYLSVGPSTGVDSSATQKRKGEAK